jgi:hypothetical protein
VNDFHDILLQKTELLECDNNCPRRHQQPHKLQKEVEEIALRPNGKEKKKQNNRDDTKSGQHVRVLNR